MNITRTAPRSEVISHLDNVDRVFGRLSLSRNDAGEKVLRSLIVDMAPQSWLDSSDPYYLEPWEQQPYLLDTGDVFFYCGWLSSATVRQWFERPEDCALTGFNREPGHRSRRESFALPDMHEYTGAIDLPSYATHGLPPLPYPITYYTLYPKSPRIMQNRDYRDVVGPNGELFDTFSLAQAEVIFGVTDRRARYNRDDLFAFRVVDARGWLKEICVQPDKLAVTLGATTILGSGFVVVRGTDLSEKAHVQTHYVSLKLPVQIADDVTVTLVSGGEVIDTASFSSATSLYPKNSPQVIVEREDVYGYAPPARSPSSTSSSEDHPPASKAIFISYRREDSAGYVGRLHDNLTQRYGVHNVFMDLAIEPGADFVRTLENTLDSCAVLLAVIGKQWLSVTDGSSSRRRLDDPRDWVRLEISRALRRGIPVIPILVHNAQMPKASDLPRNLKLLARRNAHEMTNARWGFDLEQLTQTLDRVIR